MHSSPSGSPLKSKAFPTTYPYVWDDWSHCCVLYMNHYVNDMPTWTIWSLLWADHWRSTQCMHGRVLTTRVLTTRGGWACLWVGKGWGVGTCLGCIMTQYVSGGLGMQRTSHSHAATPHTHTHSLSLLLPSISPPTPPPHTHRSAAFLVALDNATYVLSVYVTANFPEEQPRLVLQVHHPTPDMILYKDYPWSPRWAPQEMVARTIMFLRNKVCPWWLEPLGAPPAQQHAAV